MVVRDLDNFVLAYHNGASGHRKISCLPTLMVLRDLENFVTTYCNGASGLRKFRDCYGILGLRKFREASVMELRHQ